MSKNRIWSALSLWRRTPRLLPSVKPGSTTTGRRTSPNGSESASGRISGQPGLAAKPLVVHTRDSAADTLRVLKEEGADTVGGVMHCFTENWDIASLALDLGFYLSFSGIVTFKNAADRQGGGQQMPA
jgi:hypothetical protein